MDTATSYHLGSGCADESLADVEAARAKNGKHAKPASKLRRLASGSDGGASALIAGSGMSMVWTTGRRTGYAARSWGVNGVARPTTTRPPQSAFAQDRLDASCGIRTVQDRLGR
jgi:hypothetical protein